MGAGYRPEAPGRVLGRAGPCPGSIPHLRAVLPPGQGQGQAPGLGQLPVPREVTGPLHTSAPWPLETQPSSRPPPHPPMVSVTVSVRLGPAT